MGLEEQVEEKEVLASIYEGDDNFSVINDTTYQYKYGEEGNHRSFVVEVEWVEDYPDVAPKLNLDLFYNKHILDSVKEKLMGGLQEQCEFNLGMSMTFTLFEWLKEAQEELIADQPEEAPKVAAVTTDMRDMNLDDDNTDKKEKKEHLTKAQKRRMWSRQNAAGERPRGYNWVDIIKHLSQTGGANQSEG